MVAMMKIFQAAVSQVAAQAERVDGYHLIFFGVGEFVVTTLWPILCSVGSDPTALASCCWTR